MTDEKRIILPGDPGWDKPRAEEVSPELKVPVPGEALEQVFRTVVDEVKSMIPEGATDETKDVVEASHTEPSAQVELQKPGPTFKFHRPAQQKSLRIPVPKPIDAELLEDLPRSWEKKCYRTFRKGEHITLTDMTFFMGAGALYGFAEGSRGGFGVRPDQVSFSMPVVENPQSVVSSTPAPDTQSPILEEQHNDNAGRQAD